MPEIRFAGPLLRYLRLQKNWSQETLCQGICAVSYLSKIEQGKVDANPALLRDLFGRLGKMWMTDPEELAAAETYCQQLYEALFSGDFVAFDQAITKRGCTRRDTVGPYYLDLLILQNYKECSSVVPPELEALLDSRQGCVTALTRGDPELAHRLYPCAMTCHCVGVKAYRTGNYTLGLEYLQRSYDMASQEGYIKLMMLNQLFLANCYSDLRNCREMERHSEIAARIARYADDQETLRVIRYNLASTQIECGSFEAAYGYFSVLEDPSVLDLHKLAICCEKLGKWQQALEALDTASQKEVEFHPAEQKMCNLVHYRLTHPDYLHDDQYGALLMDVFRTLRREMPTGYARFHLPWVREWLTANRRYREAYELMLDFT